MTLHTGAACTPHPPTPPARPAARSPFRERLLADPSFMIKVGIEVGIGICTKCTAEYTKRGESFSRVSRRGQPGRAVGRRGVVLGPLHLHACITKPACPPASPAARDTPGVCNAACHSVPPAGGHSRSWTLCLPTC